MLDLKEKDKKQNAAQMLVPRKFFFKKRLPGLEDYHEFTLQVISDNPFFYHLQSAGEKELGLILLDPFPCFPGYSVQLGAGDILELEAEGKEDLLALTTVTITKEKSVTTNLAAPLVFNLRQGLAQQIIIPERLAERRTPLTFK